MIYRCNLPDEIVLPCGARLKPVIGGHIGQQPFLTAEHSGVSVMKNGWAADIRDPDIERGERNLIIAEAKRRKLKYRQVCVRRRTMRGRRGTLWVFVEVK